MQNQTNELQINLTKFEELAKEFIEQHSDDKDEFYCSYKSLAEDWTNSFKEFIFSEQLNQQKRQQEFFEQLNQQKRQQEFFELKKKLESMKEEFEPSLSTEVKDDILTYHKPEGDYVATKACSPFSCIGCAFEDRSCCSEVIKFYPCGTNEIIWIKKT